MIGHNLLGQQELSVVTHVSTWETGKLENVVLQAYSKQIIVQKNYLNTEIKRFITGRGSACSEVTGSCLFILERIRRRY